MVAAALAPAAAAAAAASPVEAPGYLWLVPGAPLLAFALIGIVTRPFRRLSAFIALTAMGTSFVCALWAFTAQLAAGPGAPQSSEVAWFVTGTLRTFITLHLDPLSAVMLVVVTTVALMVQVYSLGYMTGEKGLARYYAYLSLFCASMLGLVLSRNLLQMFVCWELVGACSYLLIGFWFDRDAPAFAAKKAFVTTRLGDLGFLVGVVWLVNTSGSFDFLEIQARIAAGAIPPATLTSIGLLLFCGAVGKSAQVPLHVWLPDAMEGPTPVSALIHAATMVCAGVYMVARLYFLFSAAGPDALLVVAWIGGITALFAASIALVQDDIKRVLAYSTISQLGYMMLALGCGGLTAGMFHLFTHAFFKSLLFLGAGAVIHAVHSNDMWKMGGLRKSMPWTFATFAIGSLALAGIFPFAGFFSKDEILTHVAARSTVLFTFAVLASFCTAFYMGRAVFVAFLGESRDAHAHPHEVPWVMRAPLVILAALSVVAGFWVWDFAKFVFVGEPEEVHFHLGFAVATQLVPLAGIALAWGMYVRKSPDPDALAARFAGLHRLLKHRYYVDEAYDWLIDRVVMRFSAAIAWFDRRIVDGAVDRVADLTQGIGGSLRYLQTGRVQVYAAAVIGGVAALLVLARVAGAR